MAHIFVPMISYLVEHQHKFHKDRSVRRRTRDIDFNLFRKSLTPFGPVGQEMCFRRCCRGKSGTQRKEMLEWMTLSLFNRQMRFVGNGMLAASLTCTLDKTAECVMLRSRPAMESTRGPFPRLLLSTPQKAMMMTDCKDES